MRCVNLLRVLSGLLLSAGTGFATEEHLLTVYQALVTKPDAEIGPVTYVTWYGALEESTLDAMTWPAVLDSPHEDAVKEDLNCASLLGIKLRLHQSEEEGWRLTVDLTEMKEIPAKVKAERLAEETGRGVLLQRILEAAERNLKELGIYDCRLSVRGAQAYEDLREMSFAPVINVIGDAWGEWTYKSLPRKYPDGDLRQLAARSLVRPESLHTIFIILSSETYTPEEEVERNDFLRRLLVSAGDVTFARVLGNAEALVQKRVVQALTPAPADDADRGIQWRAWFPRTFGIGAGKQ